MARPDSVIRGDPHSRTRSLLSSLAAEGCDATAVRVVIRSRLDCALMMRDVRGAEDRALVRCLRAIGDPEALALLAQAEAAGIGT